MYIGKDKNYKKYMKFPLKMKESDILQSCEMISAFTCHDGHTVKKNPEKKCRTSILPSIKFAN